MLSFNSYYFRLLTVLCLLSLFSCQSEIAEQEYNMQQTININSPLTSYIQRVAMVKTVQDNLIDKSSYCTVKLPYKVAVNGVDIEINSIADYQKVKDNINASTTDDDEVKINFPVTMIYFNYYEKALNNELEFEQLLSYWEALPDLLSKIYCLNINYPITVNSYNSTNQIASSAVITNDKSLFYFINNLNKNQFIAIKYPISITESNNSVTTVTTNQQFENVIKYAIDNCPENSNSTLDFVETLANGSWKISYFYDESEKTSLYNGYVFVFKNDKTVTATKLGVTLNGQWETKTDNGKTEFKIIFSSDLLHELDQGWKLYEFNASQIRFREDFSNAGLDNEYLYFTKVN